MVVIKCVLKYVYDCGTVVDFPFKELADVAVVTMATDLVILTGGID